MKITNYNEFLLEKEFQKILETISIIVESDETINVGDTMEWDYQAKAKGTPDESAQEIEWTFEPKSKLQKMKDKVSDFAGWLREDDPDIDVKFENPLTKKLGAFLDKVKDKEKIKEYFLRMLDEIKALPVNVKRKILKKILIVLALYLPLSGIMTNDVIEKEPVVAEVMAEVNKESKPQIEVAPEKRAEKEVEKKNSKSASFDRAQKLVKTAEADYSDDRKDTGNWIDVPGGGQRFIGTNHGISAPVLQDYFKDQGINRLITKQDMIDLEYETAKEIYKKDYWDLAGLSNFKSQSIANVLYDECVNQGVGAALTDITKSMENMGHKTDEIGSWKEFHKELTPKVNNMSNKQTRKLFQIIKDVRLERYQGAKTWVDHGVGWTKRIKAIAFEDDGTAKDSNIS
jgi:lysozyme family protein